MLDHTKQQVFIPEKYVLYLDMIVDVKKYGKGVLVEAAALSQLIRDGRIHRNVVANRDAVYILRETAATPVDFTINKGV